MLSRNVADITERDLLALVDAGESESKVLDFKRALNISTEEAKMALRKDVTSMANASGGHIVFGVEETNGIASAIHGIPVPNPDALELQIRQLLDAKIRPRLIHDVRVVPLDNGQDCVVVYTPRSFAAPHQIQGLGEEDFQFWGRKGTRNCRLDVDELRSTFTYADGLMARILAYRIGRVSAIQADEGPVATRPGPKAVLHSVPLAALDAATNLNLRKLRPLSAWFDQWSVMEGKFTFEGIVGQVNTPAQRYVHVERSGVAEGVMGDIEAGRRVLAAWNVEWELLKLLPNVLRAQAKIGVDTPVALMLTLVGVHGCSLACGADRTGAMRQDVVEVPPETVEAFGVDAGPVLQPMFDRIWNAGGWEGSPHFEDGKWYGR